MRRGRKGLTLATAGILALAGTAGTAEAGKPNIMSACITCHQAAEGRIRGKMVSASEQFKSFNVTVGPLVWIVGYGDDFKVIDGEKTSGPEALKTIPRDKEVLVTFTGGENKPVGVEIKVKQPYKVAAGKLVSVEEMQALVAKGPEAGKFTLFDSRPAPLFPEGHIPHALSLPFANFKEQAAAKLPADKEALLIFYCGGDT